VCPLCWWEDDGQDDPRADEVWGGPNGGLSLTEARRNFRDHMTMYPKGKDSRIGGEDSATEASAKRAIVAAFNRLSAQPPPDEVRRLWSELATKEAVLEAETTRKIREYEEHADDERSV
jgi:hypothetical protein